MLAIETIRGLLPSINIKSIILDDPSQINNSVGTLDANMVGKSAQTLGVRVKTTSITTASLRKKEKKKPKKKMVNSRPAIDYNEFLRVAIIQSRDERMTSLLHTLGDKILTYLGPLNQWHGNEKFDDLVYTNVMKPAGILKENLAHFKHDVMKVQTAQLFGDVDSPLVEKVDADGKEIKSIPIDFNFTVGQFNPKHLGYCVVSYIDVEALADKLDSLVSGDGKQLGIRATDLEKIGRMPTPLKYDTVFNQGRLSGDSFFYKTPSGKVWTGPVYRTSQGTYRTGHGPSNDSVKVQLVQTSNVKIQDFRNQKGMMTVKIMTDFQDEEATVRNILRDLQPKNRSLNPNNTAKDPYISDLFLSTGTRKNGKFMFLINMDDLLTNNSIFGKTIKTGRLSLRNKVFGRSLIKSLKIYRHVVKEGIGANQLGSSTPRFIDHNASPILVANTFQKPSKRAIENTSDIAEETTMSFSGGGIRAFNVTDRSFSPGDRGQHRYRLEIEVLDRTMDYMKEEVRKLSDFATLLKNYESDMLNSVIRPKQKTDNPHIKDNGQLFTRTRQVGGYDFRFDNLTPNFAIKMKNKYGADLQSGITAFVELLKMFSTDNNFTLVQETNLTNFLNLITNASTTNPTFIGPLVQLLQESISKMSSFIGINARLSDPTERKSQQVVAFGETIFATPGVITIQKKCNNILDLGKWGRGGYDYLSRNTQESGEDSANQVGLRSLGGRQFRERITREILKYYSTSQPNLTEGMTANKTKFAGGDSVNGTAFSFLSPSVINFNEIPIDTLNANRIDNSLLMKIVESKMILNQSVAKKNDEVPPLDLEFRKNSFIAATKNTRAAQIAPREQQVFLAENYNLIPTMPKSIPRGGNVVPESALGSLAGVLGTAIPALPESEQDASRSSSKAVPQLPTLQPAAFLEKIFKRTLPNTVPEEENNISLFDLGTLDNFLVGVDQQAVKRLPNQIKALFISITGKNGGELKFQPQVRKNIFQDPDRGASSTLKYKLLAEIEYLDGFATTSMSNRKSLLMTAPIFKTLTAEAYSQFVNKKILCRLRKYNLPRFGIVRPEGLDALIYDEYFIVEPDSPLAGVDPTALEGGFLTDPTRELRAAKAWGLTEEEYAMLGEFGTSFLPAPPLPLASDKQAEIKAKLGQYADSVFENPAVDSFNSNVSSNGAAVTSNMPAASNLLSNLPQLRLQLRDLRTAMAAVQSSVATLTTNLETWANEKQSLLKELDTVASTASQEQVQSVQQRIGTLTSMIAEASTSMNDTKMQLMRFKNDEVKLLAEIRAAVSASQKAIISSQIQSGIYGRCELPEQVESSIPSFFASAPAPVENFENLLSGEELNALTPEEMRIYKQQSADAALAAANASATTQDLQAQYTQTLARVMSSRGAIEGTGQESFAKFQSYMSPEDASEFSQLLEELGTTTDSGGANIGDALVNEITKDTSLYITQALTLCSPIATPVTGTPTPDPTGTPHGTPGAVPDVCYDHNGRPTPCPDTSTGGTEDADAAYEAAKRKAAEDAQKAEAEAAIKRQMEEAMKQHLSEATNEVAQIIAQWQIAQFTGGS